MKKIKYTLITIILTGVLACTKENINNEVIHAPEEDQTRATIEFYEEFGIGHNALLDEIGSAGDLAALTHEERYDLITEAILVEDPEFSMDFETCNAHIAFTNALTSDNAADEIIAMGELTENVHGAITLLFEIMEDVDIDNEDSELVTSANFVDRIAELEDFIETNCEVDYNEELKMGNDGALMLGACAIAKYSYAYWYNSIYEEDHLWHGLFNSYAEEEELDIIAARAPWIKRAWADVTNFFAFERVRKYKTYDNTGKSTQHFGISFTMSKKRASEASANVR